MINADFLKKLAVRYQTSEFPNVAREYMQHVFLSNLSCLEGASNLLFKGGTALRLLFRSPRFSEDLDFTIIHTPARDIGRVVEDMFSATLVHMEQTGIRVTLGAKPGPTTDGYFGDATFEFLTYPPLALEINVSARKKANINGEMDTIPNDYIPSYNVYHFGREAITEEKIFGALLERKKPRDFYDLYFLMRGNFLTTDQKKRLAPFAPGIVKASQKIDFRTELMPFLASSHQTILKDFGGTLSRELTTQLGLSP